MVFTMNKTRPGGVSAKRWKFVILTKLLENTRVPLKYSFWGEKAPPFAPGVKTSIFLRKYQWFGGVTWAQRWGFPQKSHILLKFKDFTKNQWIFVNPLIFNKICDFGEIPTFAPKLPPKTTSISLGILMISRRGRKGALFHPKTNNLVDFLVFSCILGTNH